MNKKLHNPPTSLLLPVIILYTLPVAVAVLYTWATGTHRYDLSLTVSLYVALQPWTAVLFFLGIAAACTLLTLYVRRISLRLPQRLVYYATFLCVFGCACFPCNRQFSVLSADIHDAFSYALVILIALSLALAALWAKRRRQRVMAAVGLAYAVLFIAAFALDVQPFKSTIFIWENGLIALLFFELYSERIQP